MFEQFPYADLQQLNLDWIIKIAKDFLDQYTGIQQLINDGIDNIDQEAANKLQEIVTALNAWYDEHSEDISAELNTAITALNTAMLAAINTINENADTKLALVLADIPATYTELADAVAALSTSYETTRNHTERGFNLMQSGFKLGYEYAFPLEFVVGGINAQTGEFNRTTSTRMRVSDYIHADTSETWKLFNQTNGALGVSVIKIGQPIAYIGEQYQTNDVIYFNVDAGSDYAIMTRVEAAPSTNVSDANLKLCNNLVFLTRGSYTGAELSYPYFGKTFIFCSNEKLHIQASQTCRYIHGNTSITGTDADFEYTIGAGLYFICLDTSGIFSADTFRIVNYNNMTGDDHPFAWVYNYWVYSPYDTVVCNTMPLLPLYVRQDVPMYINQDRLGFEIAPTYIVKTDGKYFKFKNTYKLVNANGGSIFFDAAKIANYPKNRNITLNDTVIGNKKILMIGDSITNRGYIQQYLQTKIPNATFVGSYQTGIGSGITGFACEAYPGADAVGMITNGGEYSHINGNYSDYVINYLNNNAPDIVTIEFGLNESDASVYRATVQGLIDMIREYDQANSHNTLIYVLVPFNRAESENMGDNYNYPRSNRYVASKTLALEAFSLTNCVLIPTNMILDDRYDYTWTTFDYGYGKTIDVLDDFVHPSPDIGFLKIADMIYNYLGI